MKTKDWKTKNKKRKNKNSKPDLTLSSAKSSWPPPGNWILRIGIPNWDFSLSSQTKFGTSSRAKIAEKLQFKFFRKFKTSYCSSCPMNLRLRKWSFKSLNHSKSIKKALLIFGRIYFSGRFSIRHHSQIYYIFFRNNFSLITYSFKNHFQIYVGITWA